MGRRSLAGLKWDRRRHLARLDVRDAGGRRHRRTISCGSYEEAVDRLRQFRESVTPSTGNVTFGGYVRDYWDHSISVRWALTSKMRSSSCLSRAVLPFFKDTPLRVIRLPLLREFVVFLEAADPITKRKAYAPPSVNFALRLVRLVLHHAKEREIISSVPKMPLVKEVALTLELRLEEEQRFLDAFDDLPSYRKHVQRSRRAGVTDDQAEIYYTWFRSSKPVFVVALETGLRISDLLALEWLAVDLRANLITVTQRKTGRVVSIPISTSCRAALQEVRARSLASSRWVFTQRDGGRYSVTTLRKHFATAKTIAGITRRVRLHDLRHSFGSKLASEGVSLQLVQAVMGHASISTTMRYARPDEASKLAITAALNRRKIAAEEGAQSDAQ